MNQLSSLSRSEPATRPAPKPRILLILGVLWGENGITTHLTTLSQMLIQHGWDVAIASNLASGIEGAREQADRAVQRFQSDGVQHFWVPFPALRFTPKNCADASRSLLKLSAVIRQFQPDVMHVHSLSVCPYAQVMQRLYNIPYISTCHLDPDPARSEIKVGASISKYIPTFLGNRVFAVSSDLKHAYQHILGVPQENVRLVYYGIDDAYFRPPSPQERCAAREQFNLSPNAKVICLIGRLSPIKGHDVLINALAILRAEGIDVIALCAGKGYGNEEDVVRAQADFAGVSDLVRVLGMTDARQVLWASDVMTLPSRREASPLSIQEAMLCGTVPVRTPAAGAYDQIEEGVTGFIVPFDDPKALAMRLKQLLGDEHLRSRMSAASLDLARQKFTVAQMTQSAIAYYKEVIEESNPLKFLNLFRGINP